MLMKNEVRTQRAQQAIEYCKKYLPSQGPLEYFVHHNTLHSFEEYNFIDAIRFAHHLYGAKTRKSFKWYQAQFKLGRISKNDLISAIEQNIPQNDIDQTTLTDFLFYRPSRKTKVSLHKQHFLNQVSFEETDLPQKFRRIKTFWEGIQSHSFKNELGREVLSKAGKFFAAYFDKGLAYWQMEDRQKGLLNCFFEYGRYLPSIGLNRTVKGQIERLQKFDQHSLDECISLLLHDLGVPSSFYEIYVFQVLYKLRGWSALAINLEENPLYNPTEINCSFREFIVVCLIFEVSSFIYATNQSATDEFEFSYLEEDRNFNTNFASFVYDYLHQSTNYSFDLLDSKLNQLLKSQTFKLLNSDFLFKIWHEAYEWNLIKQTSSVIRRKNHSKKIIEEPNISLQIITCIDDREESTRRYFEEIDSSIETLGYAGHFGLNILFKGLRDSHYRPLCPVSVVPEYYVWEKSDHPHSLGQLGKLKQFYHYHSRSTFLSYPLLFLTAPFSFVLFLIDIFFPRLGKIIKSKLAQSISSVKDVNLDYEASDDRDKRGYTVTEMADVVIQMIQTTGLQERLAPIVYLCGHGSESLNNPHEAAHDCGACGGGRGAPNARLFAQMANRVDVRMECARLGVNIPDNTYFVGGYHNTCNDDFLIFDQEQFPEAVIDKLKDITHRVAQLDAKERVRKFEDVPLAASVKNSFEHVQGRAFNICQPRPEYGHATNAICVVAPRKLTKNIFFDRRAFLVSYDYKQDPNNQILHALISSIVPVCAGINLEYYFSYVDRENFGSGAKQPHNITSLMGVMNGYKSDLRLGLPWQMVEIHEPVRIIIVFKTTLEAFESTLDSAPSKNLVTNDWVRIIINTPEGENYLLKNRKFLLIPHCHDGDSYFEDSLSYIKNKREILPFKVIGRS